MSHALVTIVAPLDPARLQDARDAIDALGNPARPDLAERLDRLDGDLGIHFASLHALPSFTEGKAHIILEFSADGDQPWAIGWRRRSVRSSKAYSASHTIGAAARSSATSLGTRSRPASDSVPIRVSATPARR